MLGADHVVWIVAFVLYAIDAARILSPREVLLVELSRGRLAADFSGRPFGGAGRVLAFGPLLLPHRAVFVAPWGTGWSEGPGLGAALQSLRELRAALPVVRIFATEAFGVLFLVGPLLTLALGPDVAVLYIAIVVYPTVLAATAPLCWQRRELGLTSARCARLSLEIVACPAFLPNLVRKITTAQPLAVDGGQVLLATTSPDARAELISQLENRAEELLEELESDETTPGQIRFYLHTLTSAR